MTIEEINKVAKEQNINVSFEMGFVNITSSDGKGGFCIPINVFKNMTFEVGKQFLIDLNKEEN